jgi:hypothetical protein
MFTVAFADTPFKKPTTPKQYKHIQNIGLFTEFISNTITKHKIEYPVYIQVPTDILLNTLADKIIPVMAPNGDNNKESPRLPSVN